MFHVASGETLSTGLSNDLLVQSLDADLKMRINIYTMGENKVNYGEPLRYTKLSLKLTLKLIKTTHNPLSFY